MGFKWNDLSPELRKKLKGLKAEIDTTKRRKRPRRAKPKPPSDKDRLINLFLEQWDKLQGPPLVREHAFAAKCAPPRKWRFDFAHLGTKTCIEVEGGIWMRGGGRHNRGAGFAADVGKYNAATSLGWAVMRLTEVQLKDPDSIKLILQTIHGRNQMMGGE